MAAVGLLLGGMTGTAHAVKPLFPTEHFSGTDSFDDVICDLAVLGEVEFRGVSHISPAPHSDQAFLVLDNVETTEVFTLDDDDPTTTRSVTIEHNWVFREQKATLISGNVYQFKAIDAGTFRVYDDSGALIFKFAGVTKLTAVFDTLGDSAPGGNLIDEIAVSHGHESGDFCEAFTAGLMPST